MLWPYAEMALAAWSSAIMKRMLGRLVAMVVMVEESGLVELGFR